MNKTINVGPIYPLNPNRKITRTINLFPKLAEIKNLAYLKWEKDGKPYGNNGIRYWLEAEKELRENNLKEVLTKNKTKL